MNKTVLLVHTRLSAPFVPVCLQFERKLRFPHLPRSAPCWPSATSAHGCSWRCPPLLRSQPCPAWCPQRWSNPSCLLRRCTETQFLLYSQTEDAALSKLQIRNAPGWNVLLKLFGKMTRINSWSIKETSQFYKAVDYVLISAYYWTMQVNLCSV